MPASFYWMNNNRIIFESKCALNDACLKHIIQGNGVIQTKIFVVFIYKLA